MSIIIAGGGMTGMTLALAITELTQGQVPVSLVEGQALDSKVHPGFDGRAIALAAGTCQQLTQLKLWDLIADKATPITEIHVSDRGHFGQTRLQHQDYGLPALGQVVELYDVGRRLYSKLQQCPSISLYCPQQVQQVEPQRDAIRVKLDNGHWLHGQLLVIASGSKSSLAEQCGFSWYSVDYQQTAVIANVRPAQPHRGRAFERFTEQGPLALLPSRENKMSLVWCQSQQEQQKILQCNDEQFLYHLQHAFGWRLGRFLQCGKRERYPLQLSYAQRITSHRLVLAGNSAQTLHPIAGQGFNLGMRDVMCLAGAVSHAYQHQQDLGSFPVLNSYQKQREADRQQSIALTDGLVNVFSNSYLPTSLARNVGLLVMDGMPFFRQQLAQRTLGFLAV